MRHLSNWIAIPATDLARATAFYQAAFATERTEARERGHGAAPGRGRRNRASSASRAS